MKHPILFLIALLCCLIGCTRNSSSTPIEDSNFFRITVDTITIHINDIVRPATKAEITHAVKFNNKYYCIYRDYGTYYFIDTERSFLIINLDGTIEHNIPLPEKIGNRSKLDLFVNNDTVFLKGLHKEGAYYLNDRHFNRVPTNYDTGIIYEDDCYCILQPKRNELGCTSWFRDKETGVEYEFNSHGRIINKIDSVYYITSDFRVLQIDNPAKLMPCEPERYYEILNSINFAWGSKSLEGVKVLFGDSICSHLNFDDSTSNIFIATSFTYNKELYHISNPDTFLHISKLDSGRFIPLQYINGKDMKFELNSSNLMRIQQDNSQLVTFDADYPNMPGFIEIKENKINVRYLKLPVDTIKYLHKETFPIVFNFIRDHIHSLHITSIDSLEREIGGTRLKLYTKRPLYHSYYPHHKMFEFEGAENFLKTEDEIISNKMSYDYTKNDSLVKSVFLEWLETKSLKYKYEIGTNQEKNIYKIARFERKLDEIIQTVTNTLNIEPERTKKKNGKFKLEWKEDNGLKIEVHYENFNEEYRNIRMIIYENLSVRQVVH